MEKEQWLSKAGRIVILANEVEIFADIYSLCNTFNNSQPLWKVNSWNATAPLFIFILFFVAAVTNPPVSLNNS